MKVWKHVMSNPDMEVSMSKNSTILHVGFKDDKVCIWFTVDPNDKEVEYRRVRIINTGGMDVPEGSRYFGTIITASNLVFHAFEGGE